MNNLLNSLLNYQNKLIQDINLETKRFLYEKIDPEEKLVWIVWLRGTGKTTILLQKIKESDDIENSIYFSMDNPKILLKWLFNIVEDLYFNYWYKYFYVDEIHKYENWNQELKNIYDTFPDIRLLFTGSSSVDIIKWSYDLSRRAVLYKLPLLSFREYLNLKHSLNLQKFTIWEVIDNPNKIYREIMDNNILLNKEFKEYLDFGEFPFYFSSSQESYVLKFENIINKLVYEDIASFYNLKTENLKVFKEIIYFIINSKPGLFSYNSLSKFLSISGETLKVYINILEEIGLIKLISYDWNISQEIRKSNKLYFLVNNIYSIPSYADEINYWRIRESFFVRNIINIWLNPKYTDKWDFSIKIWKEKYVFEIWWKNKTKKQIKMIENWYIVRDDIDNSDSENIIPLWMVGMLY